MQYDREYELFTMGGMEAAHKKLEQHYERAGHSDAYIGQFYASPHKFDMEMQQAAFAWLKQHLG